MNTPNLKQHSKVYRKMKALQVVLDDLKDGVIKELRKMPDKKAIEGGVEYHITNKSRKAFTSKRLKALKEEADKLKEAELAAGRYKETVTEAFDSYIPKSAEDEVLAAASMEYKKHFGLL